MKRIRIESIHNGGWAGSGAGEANRRVRARKIVKIIGDELGGWSSGGQ